MNSLVEVKAKQLMHKSLITIPAHATLRDAVRTFEEYKISGAPVVDDVGSLIGVLSAADIARTDHMDESRSEYERATYYQRNPLVEQDVVEWEEDAFTCPDSFSPEILPAESVREWMSQRIVSVDEEASLKEVCKVMTHERIHRVIVTKDGVATGIITTLDIVRFLAAGDGRDQLVPGGRTSCARRFCAACRLGRVRRVRVAPR